MDIFPTMLYISAVLLMNVERKKKSLRLRSLYHNLIVITRVSNDTCILPVDSHFDCQVLAPNNADIPAYGQIITNKIKASSFSKVENNISKDTFSFDNQVSL